MRIAISGPAGSGKTTVCMIVADKLGYELVLVGQIFRRMALEHGMDLDVFGRLAEEDETIDRELDRRMLDMAKSKENLVIEGRLAGIMMRKGGIPVLAVYLTGPEDVRIGRIAEREGKQKEEVQKDLRRRANCERKRYLAYYGLDIMDTSVYDQVIDTSELSAEQVADMIVSLARKGARHDAGKGKEPR